MFPVTPMHAKLITSDRCASIGDVLSGNAHAKLLVTSNRLQAFADLLTFVNNEHITRYSI